MEQIILTELENKIVAQCVKNLREFGYPQVTTENIFIDEVYSMFLISMLSDNEGRSTAIDNSITRIKSLIKTNQ